MLFRNFLPIAFVLAISILNCISFQTSRYLLNNRKNINKKVKMSVVNDLSNFFDTFEGSFFLADTSVSEEDIISGPVLDYFTMDKFKLIFQS